LPGCVWFMSVGHRDVWKGYIRSTIWPQAKVLP
jgi:hypothetical protein